MTVCRQAFASVSSAAFRLQQMYNSALEELAAQVMQLNNKVGHECLCCPPLCYMACSCSMTAGSSPAGLQLCGASPLPLLLDHHLSHC